MHLLAPLAALLGIEVDTITERVRNAIIINTVMIVLVVIGGGFMLAAGFFALSDLYGPIYAALILGGVFLVLALGVFLVTQAGEGRRRREMAEKRRTSEVSAFATTAALTALPVILRSPVARTLALPAAAIAAFLFFRRGSDKTDL